MVPPEPQIRIQQNHELTNSVSFSLQIGLSDRQIDDFVDLNAGEKAFFKLWNAHLHRLAIH